MSTPLTVSITPDLGWVNMEDLFDPNLNSLLIEVSGDSTDDASGLDVPSIKTPYTLIFDTDTLGRIQIPSTLALGIFQSAQRNWIMRSTDDLGVATDVQFFEVLTKL